MKYGYVALAAVVLAVGVAGEAQARKRTPIAPPARQDAFCAQRFGNLQFSDCNYSSFEQCKAGLLPNETCIENTYPDERQPRQRWGW